MFTYFIQAESGGPIKIGKAVDVAKRLASLQTGSVEKLVVLGWFDGDREREFHAQFAAFRVSGEWFAPDSSLVGFVIDKADTLWITPTPKVRHRIVSKAFTNKAPWVAQALQSKYGGDVQLFSDESDELKLLCSLEALFPDFAEPAPADADDAKDHREYLDEISALISGAIGSYLPFATTNPGDGTFIFFEILPDNDLKMAHLQGLMASIYWLLDEIPVVPRLVFIDRVGNFSEVEVLDWAMEMRKKQVESMSL